METLNFMASHWLIVVPFVVVVVSAVAGVCFMRRPPGGLEYEATVRAAVELAGIQHRLEVARARAEIQRGAEVLREEIEEELR